MHHARIAPTGLLMWNLVIDATTIALLICCTGQKDMTYMKHGRILCFARKIKSPHTEKEWWQNSEGRNYAMKKGRPKNATSNLYTVYDNRTDELVCFEVTAKKAAEIMGLSEKGFRSAATRTAKGEYKKWTIIKRKENEGVDMRGEEHEID